MDTPRFMTALHELFELDAGSISPSAVLQNIDGWNSLTFIGLIAMIDDEFGATLPPTTILKCRTVAELIDAVAAETSPIKMAA